jgi:pyruvate dehydrogenase (quinone)
MGKLVADIIVETVQSAGVKHCYGVVGDTLNLIARSLEKSEIEWVSVNLPLFQEVRRSVQSSPGK